MPMPRKYLRITRRRPRDNSFPGKGFIVGSGEISAAFFCEKSPLLNTQRTKYLCFQILDLIAVTEVYMNIVDKCN